MGGSQSSEHCDPNAKGSKIKCLVNSVSSQRSQVACSSPRRHWPVVVAMGVVTVATAAATTEVTAEVTTEATRTMLGGTTVAGMAAVGMAGAGISAAADATGMGDGTRTA
jgi:hypothetical protein